MRHGIGPKPQGGLLRIVAFSNGGEIEIQIEDDGVGMTREKVEDLEQGRGKGVGIGNVNRRMQMLFGRSIEIISSEGQGTLMKLLIPEGYDAKRTDD